jgi:1,2-diacylglycerol 3-beta-glucosyltransferase
MVGWAIVSSIILLLIIVPLGYWLLLMLASIRSARLVVLEPVTQGYRFIIAIPAHNESKVIESTVRQLSQLDYPQDLYAIHVVADYCTDDTPILARRAGAVVHERQEGPRGSKGAALSWLFQRIDTEEAYDAILVFDADTLVERQFLRVMDARLRQGDRVIQGQHMISNSRQGFFAMLAWVMFLIDNRYQNLGRANLGWSAKVMGDSICLHKNVICALGWGEGLTDDIYLRKQLLLKRIRVAYEPAARGFGEAPETWGKARRQRLRWLRGTSDVSRHFGPMLLREFLNQPSGPLLDGVFQAYFPSYSTLSVLCLPFVAVQLLVLVFFPGLLPRQLDIAWLITFILLFIYPFPALYLERAPLIAYLIILAGPFYMFWRTGLAFKSRFLQRSVEWDRTPHGESPDDMGS